MLRHAQGFAEGVAVFELHHCELAVGFGFDDGMDGAEGGD